MTTFSWLHLTDLHLGLDTREGRWNNIEQEFLEDLKRMRKHGPWDLVLFSGDLVQQGKAEEYAAVDDLLRRIWNILRSSEESQGGAKAETGPILLAVPGNHDLVRPGREWQLEVDALREWPKYRNYFWDDPQQRLRKVVDDSFANYMEWWERWQKKNEECKNLIAYTPGLLPGDFSATVKKGDIKFGIAGLNTTFTQLDGSDHSGKLALSPRQFQGACGGNGAAWADEHHFCLLMTHQPSDWLEPQSRLDLESEIAVAGRFFIHLYGHMHESRLSGVRLGGGQAKWSIQGTSLFGIEYENGVPIPSRLHGYSAGKVEIDKVKTGKVEDQREHQTARWQLWPRRADSQQDKARRFHQDVGFSLDEENATRKDRFYLHEPNENRESGNRRSQLQKPGGNDLPSTGPYLFGRELELQELDRAWEDESIKIATLVAFGGVGKTAVINHWLERMKRDNYRKATRVFAWSFSRQGMSQRGVSTDLFIDSALNWLKPGIESRLSPWDKGKELAKLLQEHSSLLVLDGIDPLLSPDGELRDQAMLALLTRLATIPARKNLEQKNLCVISARRRIKELDNYAVAAPVLDLEHLAAKAGARILKAQGVEGGESELERAAMEFGGHSLALTLMGSFLADVCQGKVTHRHEIPRDPDATFPHPARRAIAAYESLFGEGLHIRMLRLLSLFNRPADREAIAALRKEPAIEGLTDRGLCELEEMQWRYLISSLRRAGLLSPIDTTQPDCLDAHPLVREYFVRQLSKEPQDFVRQLPKEPRDDLLRSAWEQGHSRLFEYRRHLPLPPPTTIEDLAELYAAVSHGCQAKRYDEALQLYREKILRDLDGEYLTTYKLGAFSSDLSALSGFFRKQWNEPVEQLSAPSQAYVLRQAGYCLRALGRLEEATECFKFATKKEVALARQARKVGQFDTGKSKNLLKHWQSASVNAGILTYLYTITGELQKAQKSADHGVKYAERSEDRWQIWDKGTIRAYVWHYSGGRDKGVEDNQGQREQGETGIRPSPLKKALKSSPPNIPGNMGSTSTTILRSYAHFRYCELLETRGEYNAMLEEAGKAEKLAETDGAEHLVKALAYLSLGRANTLCEDRQGTPNYKQAQEHLEKAVYELRAAARQDYLPLGLLALADLFRRIYEISRHKTKRTKPGESLKKAMDLVDEAMVIIQSGKMRLLEADCLLAYTRLFLAQGDFMKANESLTRARELVTKAGYKRRDSDIKCLERELEDRTP